MPEIIQVPNFDPINLKEVTLLDADATVGQNQVTILNGAAFSDGDRVLLGNIAQENAEVATLLSIAGKVATLVGTVQNKHYRFEAFTQLFGDQIRLYRAPDVDGTAPSDSAFSYLSIYTTIQGDDISSELIDPSGGTGYWYKTTYYNSGLSNETSLSLSVAVRGGNYGRLVSIDSILLEAGLANNTQIPGSRIAELRDTAESEVLSRLSAGGYLIPLQTTSGVPYTPPVVEKAARLLAAGDLLAQEFPGSEQDSKNGAKKIKDARDLIDSIMSSATILLDATGVPLTRSSRVSGWPDDTTAIVGTDGIHGEPFQITMSKKF